jgi:hypothetical protein
MIFTSFFKDKIIGFSCICKDAVVLDLCSLLESCQRTWKQLKGAKYIIELYPREANYCIYLKLI